MRPFSLEKAAVRSIKLSVIKNKQLTQSQDPYVLLFQMMSYQKMGEELSEEQTWAPSAEPDWLVYEAQA